METFRTGQSAPATGNFVFAGHMESSTCQPTEEEKRIWVTAGETFPPCRHCDAGALWKM